MKTLFKHDVKMEFSISSWKFALFVNILFLRLADCKTLHLIPIEKIHNDANKENLHISIANPVTAGDFEYRERSDVNLYNTKISEQNVIVPSSARHSSLLTGRDATNNANKKLNSADTTPLGGKLSYRNVVEAMQEKSGTENSLAKPVELGKDQELSEIEKLLEKFAGKIKAEKANVLDARFEAITKIEQLAKQNLDDISKLKLGSLQEKEKLGKELQAAKEAINNISNINSNPNTLLQNLIPLNNDSLKEDHHIETNPNVIEHEKDSSSVESINDVKFMKNTIHDVAKDSLSPDDVAKDVNKDAFKPAEKVDTTKNEESKQINEIPSNESLKDQSDFSNLLSTGLLELTKDVFKSNSSNTETTGVSSRDNQHLSSEDQSKEPDFHNNSKVLVEGLAPPVENKPEITPSAVLPDTHAIEGGKIEAKEPPVIDKSENVLKKKKKIKILILDDDDDLDENVPHYVRKTPQQVHETFIYVPHPQYPVHNEVYPNVDLESMQSAQSEITHAIKNIPCSKDMYPGQHIHDQGPPTHVNCDPVYGYPKPSISSLDKDQWFPEYQRFKPQGMPLPYVGPGHYPFDLKASTTPLYSELHKKDGLKKPNEVVQQQPQQNFPFHISKSYVVEAETRNGKNILNHENKIDTLLNQKKRNPNENVFTPQLESLVLQALKPYDYPGTNIYSRMKFINSTKSEMATSRSKISRNASKMIKTKKQTKKQNKGVKYLGKPLKKIKQ